MPGIVFWIVNSRVGRFVALVLAALGTLLFMRARWRAEGRRAAEQRNMRETMDAINDQGESRRAVEDRLRRADDAERQRLRDKWRG